MSDNVTKALDIVDKNVDKIVNKLVELGPLAQQGAQETLSYISMRGYMAISICGFVMALSIAFFYLGTKEIIRTEGKTDAGWLMVVPSGIVLLITLLTLGINGSSWLARAWHPTGYLVMKVLG